MYNMRAIGKIILIITHLMIHSFVKKAFVEGAFEKFINYILSR